MIQKKISGDITKLESRALFGFTPRQIICSAIAFVVALLVNKIFGAIKFETRGFIMMLLAAPFLASGWVKIQGMPIEKHMMILIKNAWTNKERKYEE